MSRSDEVYLSDILESINMILTYIGDKSVFEFESDFMLQDAIIRRFEIIGEASSKISENTKKIYPNVQWRLMKAMRNKLIHDYFGVLPVTIYTTIKVDLPILKKEVESILK